jgi:prephenate dehydrogenase
MGAAIVDLPASEHDAILAFTSHLPQLVATGLAVTLADQTNENLKRIVGPGLLDMTRLAMSSPELWHSILATNKGSVLTAIDAFLGSMHTVRAAVEAENLAALFNQAAVFAHAIRGPSHT